jgi:transposase
MPGRSKITADEQERSALQALGRPAWRSEADRARAILLTLAGRRAAEIAAGLGMHVSTVREWRGRFLQGGIAALQHRTPPGRPNPRACPHRNLASLAP